MDYAEMWKWWAEQYPATVTTYANGDKGIGFESKTADGKYERTDFSYAFCHYFGITKVNDAGKTVPDYDEMKRTVKRLHKKGILHVIVRQPRGKDGKKIVRKDGTVFTTVSIGVGPAPAAEYDHTRGDEALRKLDPNWKA